MKRISEADFQELKGAVETLGVRLYEHRERDNPHGEALGRAEQEMEKLNAIIKRIEASN